MSVLIRVSFYLATKGLDFNRCPPQRTGDVPFSTGNGKNTNALTSFQFVRNKCKCDFQKANTGVDD